MKEWLNKNKKKVVMFGYAFFGLTIVIGTSFALWNLTIGQEDENEIATSCFNISFTEVTGAISLDNAFPLTEEEGSALTPYTFKVVNNCQKYAKYEINLEVLNTTTLENHEFIRVKLNNSASKVLQEDMSVSPTLKNEASKAYLLETGYLDKGETKTYDFRLWLDESVTPTVNEENHTVQVQNLTFNSKITIRATYSKKIEKKPMLAGLEIPVVDEGPGLYEVDHDGVEITDEEGNPVEGWDAKELRFAGPSEQVNNYVTFNDEPWRIIGLVNVQTTSGTITQRLKIIKADDYTSAAWDSANTNNWTTASLQTTLNGDYLSGLQTASKNMIATDIRWNLGGYSTQNGVITSKYYEYERGTTVYQGNPTYWENPGQATVALMYPSDYGYASSGGSTYNRSQCLAEGLYRWDTESYKTDCAGNDWLYDSIDDEWTLMPDSGSSYSVFRVDSTGFVYGYNYNASYSNAVRPVVYLKSDVQLTNEDGADGSIDNPYQLKLEASEPEIDLSKRGTLRVIEDGDNSGMWNYKETITKIYIQNKISTIEGADELTFDEGSDTSLPVKSYLVSDPDEPECYIAYLQSDGGILLNENSSNLFKGFVLLKEIHGLEYLDATNVTDMSYMFSSVGSYQSTQSMDIDLSHFKVSSAVNIYQMFSGINGVRSINLSGWDFSNQIESVETLFESAYLPATMNLSKTISPESISLDTAISDEPVALNLSGALINIEEFTIPLTVDTIDFTGAKLGDEVTGFTLAAQEGSNLSSVTVDNFDLNNTQSFRFGLSTENLTSLSLGHFDTSGLLYMTEMFSNMPFLTSLDLGDAFEIQQVEDMTNMFSGSYSLENISYGDKFKYNGTATTDGMFEGVDQSLWPTDPSWEGVLS